MFDGVSYFEITLFFVGLAFCLVLLFTLIRSFFVEKAKEFKATHVGTLVLSITMVAFPGVKKISFQNLTVEIGELTEQIAEAPNNQEAKEELENKLEKIPIKKVTSPENLAELSKSYQLIGKDDKALELANEALEKDPELPKAKETKYAIELSKNIEAIKRDPNNNALKNEAIKDLNLLINLNTKSKFSERYIQDATKLLDTSIIRQPVAPPNGN